MENNTVQLEDDQKPLIVTSVSRAEPLQGVEIVPVEN